MLQGKTAVITGATRGIGLAVAIKFAANGANVVLNGMREDGAEKARRSILAMGGRCEAVCGDIGDPRTSRKLLQVATDAFGKTDILVNNAGINLRVPFEALEEQDWQRLIQTNLTGTFYVVKAFVGQMREGGGGSIVNISSSAAKTPHPNAAAGYAASKGGLDALSRQWAYDFAKHNIRVNALCPGPIETDMSLEWSAEYREQVLRKIPLGRLGTPEDVAEAALFLACDRSAFITGETININGGSYMN